MANRTVTLSDGSVWRYGGQYLWQVVAPVRHAGRSMGEPFCIVTNSDKTASDLRAIADVLEPPALPEQGAPSRRAVVDAILAHCPASAQSVSALTDRLYRLFATPPATPSEREAVIDAIELAVETCSRQSEKGIPAAHWVVDYASICKEVAAAPSVVVGDTNRLDWLDDGTGRTVTIERRRRGNKDEWRVKEISLTDGERAPNGELCEHRVIATGRGPTLRMAIDAATLTQSPTTGGSK